MKSDFRFNDKYMGKYRIPSARHPTWDYSRNGKYFITICSHNRLHHFGKITNKEMQLSEIGQWADACWYEIPSHFPYVKLHNHIIMPDHMHGIIEIAKTDGGNAGCVQNAGRVQTQYLVKTDGLNAGRVQTQNFASLAASATNPLISPRANPRPYTKNRFGPQSKNLASIVRGYKIGVTKNARKINPNFKWQPRFYDIIIRNERAFHCIQNYIANNPKKWKPKHK